MGKRAAGACFPLSNAEMREVLVEISTRLREADDRLPRGWVRIITAYVPNPAKWEHDWDTRKRRQEQ
ncbi:MAG: hypothetical protein ACUVRF_06690 [Desulfotomaculales bacterium]